MEVSVRLARFFCLALWGLVLAGCDPQQPGLWLDPAGAMAPSTDAVLAVERVVPRSLPIGSRGYVRIEGSGFVSGCQVSIGGLPSPQVEFRSPTELQVMLPQPLNRPGAQRIEVSSDAQRAEREQLFFLRSHGVELDAPSIRPMPTTNRVRLAVDLDRDGRDDLITSENMEPNKANEFWVFMADGQGNLMPPRIYAVPGLLFALRSADLNRDGNPDLVAYYLPLDGSSGSHGRLLLYRGDGSGNLATTGELQTEGDVVFPSSDALVIADIDRDGLFDLIYVEEKAVAFQRGSGPFRFEPAIRSALPILVDSVYVGAFDEDSNLDLVATWRTDYYESQLVMLSGDGRGGFIWCQLMDLSFAPWSVAVGDLNGDGNDDILISSHFINQRIYVFFSEGSEPFAEAIPYETTLRSQALFLADYDRDGSLDVVSAGDDGTELLHNNGRGELTAEPPIDGLGGEAAVVGDFDGDGFVDLALSRYEYPAPKEQLTLRKDVASRSRSGSNALPLRGDVSALVPVWLGSDDRADLICGTSDNGGLSLFPNLGQGGFGSRVQIAAAGPISAAAILPLARRSPEGDLVDLIVLDYSTAAKVFSGGPRDFKESDPLELGTMQSCAAAGDLDGSGSTDLAFCGADGFVYLVYRSLEGRVTSTVRLPVAGLPTALAIADLDRDGWPELAVLLNSPDGLVVLDAPGREQSSGAPRFYLAGRRPRSLAVADLNLDGHLDIGVGADSGVSVFLGDGRGGMQAVREAGEGFDCRALVFADLDGDGSQDILCASALWHAVIGLLGDGSGLFPVQRAWHVGANAITLAVADFDGDGRPDIAAGSQNRVLILRNLSQ